MCHGHWANFQKRKFNFLVPIERIDFFVCGKAPSPASQKESQTQPNPLGFLLAGSSTRGQSVTITRNYQGLKRLPMDGYDQFNNLAVLLLPSTDAETSS
jgi:hypothetical protein